MGVTDLTLQYVRLIQTNPLENKITYRGMLGPSWGKDPPAQRQPVITPNDGGMGYNEWDYWCRLC